MANLGEHCWLCGQKLDWGEYVEMKMSQEESYRIIELCLEYDKDMSEYPERYDVALRIAREVFQKQVPMKPVYDHRYAEMGCAFCGNSLGGLEELPDYCPFCGQAIDWRIE